MVGAQGGRPWGPQCPRGVQQGQPLCKLLVLVEICPKIQVWVSSSTAGPMGWPWAMFMWVIFVLK